MVCNGGTGTPGRMLFVRPAIPIDIAAFSYQFSVLKTARLIFFVSGRARESDGLAPVDVEDAPFEGLLFAAIVVIRWSPPNAMLAQGLNGHRTMLTFTSVRLGHAPLGVPMV